ncbi:NADPH-dependent FMN reductase [Bacillus infantis]|uniref:NADPH-dependent FMN reductase n=1 Tax=Bacillus infantis TaxID=324767 RepID=UPI003CFA3C61
MEHILLISGSLAVPAHTKCLIEETADNLNKLGCKTTVWDLHEKPLPMADPRNHNNPSENPINIVKEFVRAASEADAFVLGSPNYHNSYSGVLKNALDILNMDLFRDKPVGLVGNGGGIRSTQPIDHLRIVVRGLLGVAIPMQVASCNKDYDLKEDAYVIIADDLRQRIAAFSQQLLLYTQKLKFER